MGLSNPKYIYLLKGYSDDNFAGCQKNSKGACQFLGPLLSHGLTRNKTRLLCQKAKAEYIAARSCCVQILSKEQTLDDFGVNFEKIPMYFDSTCYYLEQKSYFTFSSQAFWDKTSFD